MAIQVTAKSLDEIPEVMREFVTGSDGVFSYDEEKAFAALKTERENARTARGALVQFRALNLTPERIKAFADLGKSPAELAELIAKAARPACRSGRWRRCAARVSADGFFAARTCRMGGGGVCYICQVSNIK